jgi:hypothetical protein
LGNKKIEKGQGKTYGREKKDLKNTKMKERGGSRSGVGGRKEEWAQENSWLESLFAVLPTCSL